MNQSINSGQGTKFISLRIKLLIGFTVVIAIFYTSAYHWFYQFAVNRAVQRIREDLVGTLKGAIAGIDGDQFEALSKITLPPGQHEPLDNPLYTAHQNWLYRVSLVENRANPFTFIRGQKPYEVRWIGDVSRIIRSCPKTAFQESYTADPAKTDLYRGLTEIAVLTNPYTDVWGTWISAFGPIKNSRGKVVGALGIDFKADYVLAIQQSIRNVMFISFVCVYGSLATLIYLVAGVVTRPLNKLQLVARRIGQGDYGPDLAVLNRTLFPDETDILARAFQEMVNNIQTRELQLKETRTERDRFFNYSIDLMAIFDSEGVIQQVNPAWENVLGYSPEVLEGRHLLHFVHPDDRELTQLYRQQLASESRTANFEHRWRSAAGAYHWLSWNWVAIPAEGKSYGFARDISDRKQVEEQLLYSAFYDSLTDLPNRAFFMERLQTALHRAQREEGPPFAILLIDLDQFKVVNDSLGHLAGDQLLTQVGLQLRQCIRSRDTVARLGGDEFAMLLENIQHPENAIPIAERIQEKLSQPFSLHGQELVTSASIGIAFSHDQTTGQPYASLTDLLRDADIAMYRAKQQGKACYAIFDNRMHDTVLTRLPLEMDLRRAIDRSELFLCYQPILSLQSGKLKGFEALLRWTHPVKGFISPGDFIPIAEETGLIVPIGIWVLQTACQQLRQWQLEKVVGEDVKISVNVAGRQFAQNDLVEQIQQILQAADLPPENLCIEVTESAIAENLNAVIEKLNALKAIGVQISIDDFGTGHSSLSRLQSLPVHTIKVDRSFVHNMEQRQQNREFVRAIVNFAHSLGMNVVAEGIETVEQQLMLQAFCSEYGQGYLFAHPMKREDVVNWLRSATPNSPEVFHK